MLSAPVVGLGFGLRLPVKRSRADRVKRIKPNLTPAAIQEIYEHRWELTQVETAKRYNTSQSIVSRIWNRRAWCSVTDTEGGK